MTLFTTSNICSRCGKQRIATKTRTEKIGNSEVTYVWTVCPDPECQKKVDKGLAIAKRKRNELKQEAERRFSFMKAAKDEK